MLGKKISFKIFSFKIIQFTMYEGEILTAEHFYFQRNIKDAKFILKIFKKFFKIDKDTIIFDPACGTGKHLLFLTDKYNCKS